MDWPPGAHQLAAGRGRWAPDARDRCRKPGSDGIVQFFFLIFVHAIVFLLLSCTLSNLSIFILASLIDGIFLCPILVPFALSVPYEQDDPFAFTCCSPSP